MRYSTGCPFCGGLVVAQPARLVCLLGGHQWETEHVPERERRLERAISRQLTRWTIYDLERTP
jgi:hypothetical protein